MILRHLALPGHVDDSFAVLDQMAAWNKADPGCFLPSVMSQYTPFYQSNNIRKSTVASQATNTRKSSMPRLSWTHTGFMQEKSSAKEEYTPPFELQGI